MIPFLRAVARETVARYGADLRDICFVLPGKRACLFLERHLRDVVEVQYERLQRRGERPMVMTFAEFAEKVTGRRTGSSLELLFSLFDAWQRLRGAGQDFEQFRSWADTVLSDFDEIDRYDVEAAALFRNIETHNEISTDYLSDEQRRVVAEYFGVERLPRSGERMWAHMRGESELKRNFMDLWQMLAPLYDTFREVLREGEYSYGGALAREAADLIQLKGEKALPGRRVIMAGFDALTTVQLRMFDALKKLRDADGEPVAEFFWDAPGTPLSQESPVDAGRFQWLNMERYPCRVKGMEGYTRGLTFPAMTDVVACPGNTAQAKVAGLLLEDIVAGRGAPFTDPARVAVVLPDEGLLFPMYYAVPERIAPDVNLTMGYPLRMTSVYSFVVLLRKLQRSVRRGEAGVCFHHKETRTLLSHPFMQMMLGVETVERIQGAVLARHLFYVTQDDLLELLPEETRRAAGHVLAATLQAMGRESTGEDVCRWLRGCLELVLQCMVRNIRLKERKRLDVALVQAYLGALDEFERLTGRHGLAGIKWRTALMLLDRVLQNYTVHLQGQPLTGVQVMGMLETRALDFDYLIIPSMNERIFPRRLRIHTFIPDTLRRGWMLPTLRQKEQEYAYHFYRLIARAREVHLLYDASQSGRKSGDPSRYLLQLKYLFEKECGLRWRSARFNINTPVTPALRVEKHAEDLAPFLTRGSGRNLSASSLKDYLACTLRFYLAHVLKKKLRKEPEEFMDAATQGTILHDSMEAIYDSLLPEGFDKRKDPPCVRRIEKQTVRDWLEGRTMNLDAVVERMVRKNYPAATRMEALSGDSQIMAEVIGKYVRACLHADLELAPFEYIDNEHKVTVEYPLGQGRNVNMTFIIDRLDRLMLPGGERRLRIVDYKTGSDDLNFKKVAALFHPSSGDGNTKGIFQLMLYALLYPLHDAEWRAENPIALSIYRTRTLEVSGYQTMVEMNGVPLYSHLPLLEEFRTLLHEELSGLFDLSRPFEQTDDLTKCAFCDFRQMCGR